MYTQDVCAVVDDTGMCGAALRHPCVYTHIVAGCPQHTWWLVTEVSVPSLSQNLRTGGHGNNQGYWPPPGPARAAERATRNNRRWR